MACSAAITEHQKIDHGLMEHDGKECDDGEVDPCRDVHVILSWALCPCDDPDRLASLILVPETLRNK